MMPEGILAVIVVVAVIVALASLALVLSGRGRRQPPGPARGAVKAPERPERAPVSPTGRDKVARPPEQIAVAPARPSLRDRLVRSRRFLADRLADAFGGSDEELWDDLEAALIQADVGVDVATRITKDLRDKARDQAVRDEQELRGLLAGELVELFNSDSARALSFAPMDPTVWLVVGSNGTGKTTTIGKLAHDLQRHDRTVALAASDTFRAAADEQLGVWAERTQAHLVKHQPGADPGAVAFDAYRFAKARSIDVLIVDTAGRLHTKRPLMDELGKIRRVIEKEGTVQEALLIIDATGGQNGLAQAREFASAAGVTGVVLTKLDGTAKGGIALAIENTLNIPIKLIGVGESVEDLEPFDPKSFVDALLS